MASSPPSGACTAGLPSPGKIQSVPATVVITCCGKAGARMHRVETRILDRLSRGIPLLCRQDLIDHAAVDVGQAEIAAAEAERQLLVVQAEQVEDGGVQIVDGQGILHGPVAVFVRGPEY